MRWPLVAAPRHAQLQPCCRVTVATGLVLLAVPAQDSEPLRLYRAPQESACGVRVEVFDHDGWRYLATCGRQLNPHFSAYHYEALVLPALSTLGPGAKSVLVLGGADGGLCTQLLKSRSLEQVVMVSNDAAVTDAARRYLYPLSDGLEDRRLEVVVAEPEEWLNAGVAGVAGTFDIVIIDGPRGESELEGRLPKPDLASTARMLESSKSLMSPRSLLVHYGSTLWDLPRLQELFEVLSQHFHRVRALQSASVDSEPWHEVSFVAGGTHTDVLDVDWGWWRQQRMPTLYYSEAMHTALLVPSATLSRALGLKVPEQPDLLAVQERNLTAQTVRKERSLRFMLPPFGQRQSLLRRETEFQRIEVFQQDGFVALHLDGELQLTSHYGDFYHEALVHPAMAALGPRGRRALVVGAGDGGVATALLRYPLELVVQVEIDRQVVEASRRFLPEMARGLDDPRLQLITADAIRWVVEEAAAGRRAGEFDLCIIDTTDNPLVSPFSRQFFAQLRQLLAPHGALVQNVGSMGDWLFQHLEMHRAVFEHVHPVSVNTPDYPSPYFLHLATDGLDPFEVDWSWWSGLGLDTIYYHPTLHRQLFVLPHETTMAYASGGHWQPYDAEAIRRWRRGQGGGADAASGHGEL